MKTRNKLYDDLMSLPTDKKVKSALLDLIESGLVTAVPDGDGINEAGGNPLALDMGRDSPQRR